MEQFNVQPGEVGLSGLTKLTDDYFIIPKASLTPHGANLNVASLLAGEPRAGSQLSSNKLSYLSKRSQGSFRSQPRARALREHNSSVAIENKLDHDRKLQNIYEKSLRHYHDIS